MSIGEISMLIAAIAFAVLVIFIGMTLMKITKVLENLHSTVSEVNSTLSVVTKDVDNLSVEVEGLLNKANTLVDDVNGKLGKTDPLFTAIGDIGITVSDLNDSTREMTVNFVNGVNKKKSKKSGLDRLIHSSLNKFKSTTQSQVDNDIAEDRGSNLEKYRPDVVNSQEEIEI